MVETTSSAGLTGAFDGIRARFVAFARRRDRLDSLRRINCPAIWPVRPRSTGQDNFWSAEKFGKARDHRLVDNPRGKGLPSKAGISHDRTRRDDASSAEM